MLEQFRAFRDGQHLARVDRPCPYATGQQVLLELQRTRVGREIGRGVEAQDLVLGARHQLGQPGGDRGRPLDDLHQSARIGAQRALVELGAVGVQRGRRALQL